MSFGDYRLFYDGHVQLLEINTLTDDSQVCLFSAKVKPTRRDRTYLNQSCYQLFVVMDKVEGEVKMVYCQCIGGSDGACRHIGAALYGIENVEPTSCTDGANQWMKRPRLHDAAVPVKNLTVLKGKIWHNS
ncbi:uncharacterized protein LOC124279052, partial [Haliotis rubra]|uniref:uncharacterized protein LOC124279052 n=1 Tax=Haliotis rubra TaxID=36100 RepID=UPI001EE54714